MTQNNWQQLFFTTLREVYNEECIVPPTPASDLSLLDLKQEDFSLWGQLGQP